MKWHDNELYANYRKYHVENHGNYLRVEFSQTVVFQLLSFIVNRYGLILTKFECSVLNKLVVIIVFNFSASFILETDKQ
jgi:hypothetical protein